MNKYSIILKAWMYNAYYNISLVLNIYIYTHKTEGWFI